MKPHQISVADLMITSVTTVNQHEPVIEAHADMQVGAFRHLPVVDDRKRLVGILSDRDVTRALSGNQDGLEVADIMTRHVVTVGPSTPAHHAAQLMLERVIGALPVVDDSGALVGVITQTDFLELARRALLGLPLARD